MFGPASMYYCYGDFMKPVIGPVVRPKLFDLSVGTRDFLPALGP